MKLHDSPLGLAMVLARFDGDVRLLAQLAGIFIEETPLRMDAIHESVRAGDADAVRAAAHGLKGVLYALGASEAASIAEEVEQCGCASDLGRANVLALALGRHVDDLLATVRTWPALLAPMPADAA